MSAIALLAIVPADRVASAPDGYAVVRHGDLAALYEEREERPATDREALLAFGRTVTEVSAAGPALPVRYGTVVDSVAELCDLLEERQQEWLERLSVVGGHVELLVHVNDVRAPAPTQPERGTPGAGREYLLSRAAARRHGDSLFEDLAAQVEPHCRELRRLRGTSEVRVACLVPADGVAGLRAAVEAWAGADEGRRVTTTGPWPPFSFTEKEPHEHAP